MRTILQLSARVCLALALGAGCGRQTPVHATLQDAVLAGDLVDIRCHCRQGADVNAVAEQGWTPLMMAAYHGDPVLIRFLLQRGAQVDARNTAGATALMISVNACNRRAVKCLLAAGAEVNACTETGENALSLAVRHGDLATTEWLLRGGADLRRPENRGAADWLETDASRNWSDQTRREMQALFRQYGVSEEPAPGSGGASRRSSSRARPADQSFRQAETVHSRTARCVSVPSAPGERVRRLCLPFAAAGRLGAGGGVPGA